MKKRCGFPAYPGAQLTELTLILVGLGLMSIVALTTLGQQMGGFFEDIVAQFKPILSEKEVLLSFGKESAANTLVPDETFKDSPLVLSDPLFPVADEMPFREKQVLTNGNVSSSSLGNQETSTPKIEKGPVVDPSKANHTGIGNVIPPPEPGEKQECYSSGLCINIPDPGLYGRPTDLSGGLGGDGIEILAKQMDQIAEQLAHDPNTEPEIAKMVRALALEGHQVASATGVYDDARKVGSNWSHKIPALHKANHKFLSAYDKLDKLLNINAITDKYTLGYKADQERKVTTRTDFPPALQDAKALIGKSIQAIQASVNQSQKECACSYSSGDPKHTCQAEYIPRKKFMTVKSNQICSTNTTFGGHTTTTCTR